MFRKIISIVLTLSLCFGLSTATAFGATKASSVKITTPKSAITLYVGDTKEFKVAVKPSKLISKAKWTSSNKAVATVSLKNKKKGTATVKPLKPGTSYIQVAVDKKKSQKIQVTVKNSGLPMSSDVESFYKKVDINFAEKVGETLANDSSYFDNVFGFRTAGSDAEHAMAGKLEKIFENEVGLKPANVDQVEVKLDKWQSNYASLKLNYTDNGAKSIRVKEISSYAANGTDGNLTKEMVYVDFPGTKAQFDAAAAGDDDFFDDKIVLTQIDQYNYWWITTHYIEAYERGAAAIIFYETGDGYGGFKDDSVVMQDICAPDYIPCASISKKDGLALKAAIAADAGAGAMATVNIDNEVGTTQSDKAYNVVAKIPGTENTGQQIVIGAHYDKYFIGWEDDAIAIGTVAAIAKAMVDSKYQPRNDIVFVAFSGEEWGQTASLADWAAGSWQQIQKAAPEWSGKTLAMINFELPGIDSGATYGIMRSSRELGAANQKFMDSGLLKNAPKFSKYTAKTGSTPVNNPTYKITDGVQVLNDDVLFLTDAAAFQMSGVPCILPREETRAWWTTDFYHAKYDVRNADGINGAKYDSGLVKFDIAMYGALAEFMDKTPAYEMDFEPRLAQLEASLTADTDAALSTAKGGTKTKASYDAAIAALRAANTINLGKAKSINARYITAYQNGGTAAQLKAIADEGKALNEKTLEAFKEMQGDVLGVNSDYDRTRVKHANTQNNVTNLKLAINNLSKDTIAKEDLTAAMVALRSLPSATYAYRFGKQAYTDMVNMTNGTDKDAEGRNIPTDNWGYENLIPAPTGGANINDNDPGAYWTASQLIMDKAKYNPATRSVGDGFSTAKADYASAVTTLEEALAKMQTSFDGYFDAEVEKINAIATLLNPVNP
ncbi:MAG: M28 family peptidase [Anaerovoracaceae bacterium]